MPRAQKYAAYGFRVVVKGAQRCRCCDSSEVRRNALKEAQMSCKRIKFNVEINDATGSIPATIFAEKAEELYNITAAEIINNTTDGNLSVQMIQKLSAPKNSAIMLRASMYTYGVISQCVFSVYSIINSTSDQQPVGEASSQDLGPKTPQKCPTKSPCTPESATNKDIIEEDEPVEPLKKKQKMQ